MSQVMTFKCPSCGAYLEFDPASQQFRCPYCGETHSAVKLSKQTEPEPEQAQHERASLRSYHCTMCGAEIVTDSTTAATRCYYCHSPVVLSDRLSDEFRPDGVIPFQLDKKAAQEQFKTFIQKKHFVRKDFFSQTQMEDFSGVYYPYWACDVAGQGEFHGEGTKVSVHRNSKETVTITRFYAVEREGRLTFRQVMRKALRKADGKLSDGIHPYQLEAVKPYEASYLSGFLAEKRDVEKAEARESVLEEVKGYSEQMFIQADNPYQSLHGRASFTPDKVRAKYLLLPAWVLTYKHRANGEPYYYMMNGQTGRVCGKLPINRGKLFGVGALLGVLTFALLCLGGAFIW